MKAIRPGAVKRRAHPGGQSRGTPPRYWKPVRRRGFSLPPPRPSASYRDLGLTPMSPECEEKIKAEFKKKLRLEPDEVQQLHSTGYVIPLASQPANNPKNKSRIDGFTLPMVLELLVDTNDDGLPTIGERVAVLEMGGTLTADKDRSGIEIDASER